MPILKVIKNEKHIATVGSGDVWMFKANIGGNVWGPETSLLGVSGGGLRKSDDRFDHLIWLSTQELADGDSIKFFFEEGLESSPKGTIFDATSFLPLEPKFEMSYPPTEEDIKKLESRPILNASLKWIFSLNGNPAIEVMPDITRQNISLSLIWTDSHPDYIRVSIEPVNKIV
jgi:hypothetical protein